MQAVKYLQTSRARLIVVALIGVTVIALVPMIAINFGAGSVEGAPPAGAATSYVPDLARGPVAGMPKGTYEALTATAAGSLVPGLANGPIAGMPQGTYQELTGRN